MDMKPGDGGQLQSPSSRSERLHWLRPHVLLSTMRKNVRGSNAALFVLVGVIWCLFLLPIVFYHVNTKEDTSNEEPSSSSHENHSICENHTFTTSICGPYMEELKRCSAYNATGDSPQHSILTASGSQVKVERKILGVLALLRQLNASEQCLTHAYSFACQYFYPTCTPTNDSAEVHLPSAEHCKALLTHCARPLQRLDSSVATQLLPDCTNGSSTLSVLACSGSGNETSLLPDVGTMACKEDFILVDGICLARCDSWESVSHSNAQAIKLSVIFSSTTSLIGCIAVLSAALYRRKTVFVFPSVFIVYHTLSCCAIAIVALVNYIDQDGLFCTEETVVQVYTSNPSPFCTISGVIWNYCFINLTWWWFLHVCCIFWKMMFPFHARACQHRHTYIHITLLIAGLVLPISSIVAAFASGGYSVSGFPPLLCVVKDQTAEYYSMWLVINLLLIAGITMLIAMTWRVHKHQGFFKEQSGKTFKLTAAEKKLVFVFAYYIVSAVLTLVFYSLAVHDFDAFLDAVREYFMCEAIGHNPENPCPKLYEQYRYPRMEATVYILIGFIPSVNLVFVINSTAVKNGVTKTLMKLHCITPHISDMSSSQTHDKDTILHKPHSSL